MLSKTYKFLLEKAILPLGDRVEGGNFMHWLQQYRREQWLSAAELNRLQRQRLTQMLAFARAQTPFYADLPKALDNPFEDIKQFPILNKSTINKNIERLVTKPQEKLIASSGSGSSGVQGTVYLDKSAQASQRAMQLLWFEWCGYQLGDSILQTGMTTNRGFIKSLKDRWLRTTYIPAFNLDRASLNAILRQAEKHPQKYLFGYASSLFVLAQTAMKLGFSTVNFKYAVSWGDKLFPHYRQQIRQAFGCETLDTYGCTEGLMIGAQCTFGKFHLCSNQNYLEVVDDDGQPVSAGTMGKVVATRLDNFAMPLIRYYLGDLIELDSAEPTVCECGRALPLLRRVIGRDTDIVRTCSGKQLIVHFFTGIFEHVPEITQFQIVQKHLSGIDLYYIPAPGFNAELRRKIEKRIQDKLQENFFIQWIETDFIESTKSGKPQIIQTFLPQSLSH